MTSPLASAAVSSMPYGVWLFEVQPVDDLLGGMARVIG